MEQLFYGAAALYFVVSVVAKLRACIPDAWAEAANAFASAQWAANKTVIVPTALAALGMALFFIVPGAMEHADRGDTEGETLGVVKTAAVLSGSYTIAYFEPWFFIDATAAKRTLPLVACAFAGQARLLADQLSIGLGPRGNVLNGGDEHARRQRMLRHCGLHADFLGALTDGVNETFFEAHIARPLFWELTPKPVPFPGSFADLRVKELIVARNASVYMQVGMVRQAPGSASFRLLPTVLSEEDILAAAAQWSRRLDDLMGKHAEILRCLCMPHFGVLGSGLFLHYAKAAREWKLLVGAAIGFNDSFAGLVTTNFRWADRPLSFPGSVDGHYGVNEVAHYARVVLQYASTAAKDDGFVGAVRETDASFTLNPETRMPLALRVPVARLPQKIQRLDTLEEASCFHHCLVLEDRAAARYAQWQHTRLDQP